MPTDAAPVVLLLGDADWTDLTALLSMYATVVTDLAHADHDAELAAVAIGATAQEAYPLAAAGRLGALVLVAAEPPAAALTGPLAEQELPVFLVWGEDDEVVPVAVGEEMTDLFPMATLAVVPEASNDVFVTDAPTILPLIKEYLKVRFFHVGHHDHAEEPMVFDLASFSRPEPDLPEVDDE